MHKSTLKRPFRIDYVNTVKEKENIKDKTVSAIDVEPL